MNKSDKLLLAILSTVPIEQEMLSIENFNNELNNMGIIEEAKQYQFLFNNKLVNIYESEFLSFGRNDELKIKTSNKKKYVYLTEIGRLLLFNLQSILLREQFNTEGEINEANRSAT